MTCDQPRQQLLDLRCGVEDFDGVGRLLAHLKACESCRSASSDFDAIIAELKSRDPAPEPAGGWAAFEERLRRVGESDSGPERRGGLE